MPTSAGPVRLRQVVIAAAALDPVVDRLRACLPLAEPYADPGVGLFGLRNAVMALGDTFVEVISPVGEGTAAGRFLQRRGGDAGYMVLVQVPDTGAARERAAAIGVRTVWQADLPDISGTHLHPRDTGGTLLSLDTPRPPRSWHWAGPAWTGGAPEGAAGGPAIAGATFRTPDPEAVAARWAALLDREPDGPEVALDGGSVRFAAAPTGAADGLCEVRVAGLEGPPVVVAGVCFCRAD